MHIQNKISLLSHNTFGIDVKANTVVTYDNSDELCNFIRSYGSTLPRPFLNIGQGSNLLFMNDFKGTIFMSNISSIDIIEDNTEEVIVRVGSGWIMDEFISYAIANGWYGLENLSNIPGMVGASAVQNIGAYGTEIGDFILSVHCISLEDGSKRTFSNDLCKFSYRHSIFKEKEYKNKYAVICVDYKLQKIFSPNLDYGGIRQQILSKKMSIDNLSADQLRRIIVEIRDSKLPNPKIQGNAGSFFMNPVVNKLTFDRILKSYPNVPNYVLSEDQIKIPAAWLIEQCGWKGKCLNSVGVHDRQPLVLVNLGNASGEDIKKLSDMIVKDVEYKFSITIIPEVNFIY